MDKQTLHPELIRAHIKMRGKTLSALARENKVDVSTVQKALYSPSQAGERIIAAFLCVPLHLLWPDRWTQEGKRVRPRYKSKYNI